MTETLEEAAVRLVPNRTLKTPFGTPYEITPNRERNTFIKGAKWQQERSYSEDELIILLKKFKKDIINSTELGDDFETLICDIKTDKWFNKNKK